MQLVTPDLQQLYKYLEEDFNPLLLCKRVVPILEKLQEDKLFSQYIEPLKAIVLVRLVKQVSLLPRDVSAHKWCHTLYVWGIFYHFISVYNERCYQVHAIFQIMLKSLFFFLSFSVNVCLSVNAYRGTLIYERSCTLHR